MNLVRAMGHADGRHRPTCDGTENDATLPWRGGSCAEKTCSAGLSRWFGLVDRRHRPPLLVLLGGSWRGGRCRNNLPVGTSLNSAHGPAGAGRMLPGLLTQAPAGTETLGGG